MADYDFDAAVKTKTIRVGGKDYTIQEPSVDFVLRYTKRAKDLENLDVEKDTEAVLESIIETIRDAAKIPVQELRKKPISVLMKIAETAYSGWDDVSKNP